jgi:hypothetical protein
MGLIANTLLKAADRNRPAQSSLKLELVEKANALPHLFARMAGAPADVHGKDRYEMLPVSSDLEANDLHEAVIKHAINGGPTVRDQTGQKVGDLVGGLFVWPDSQDFWGEHIEAGRPWAGVRWSPHVADDPPQLSLSADGLRAA